MSVYSDVQILSIRVMEAYAKKNHVSVEDALNIFHKCQVYENILIQYEYLHQVSFEEVMEYVEKIIEEGTHKLLVFHGTTKEFEKIDLGKSRNRRDFGMGFYTTILENQAKEWAYRLSLREKINKYFVYEYIFLESERLNVKRFDGLNQEWLEFVKENRSLGGLQHNFDVVIGPVADDNTMETIQLYITNTLTANEAVERLRYSKVNNQISFHTEKALLSLTLERRQVYDGGYLHV